MKMKPSSRPKAKCYAEGGVVASPAVDEKMLEAVRNKRVVPMPVVKEKAKDPGFKATPSEENLPPFLRGKKPMKRGGRAK